MIKTFRLLLISMMCILIVLSMCACNSGGSSAYEAETSNSQSTTQATEAEAQPETSAGVVSQGEPVDASYFDNAAFVGDSVSLKLSYYAAATGALGNAQFFTAGSLGSANALWEVSDESVHPSYQGVKMTVEDCIASSGADVVYIMLGMNDIGLYGIEDSVKNYKTLAERILVKTPSVRIVVQSMTPMTDTSEILGESLNNENIKLYNEKLKELCAQQGWAFVDVASVMYDAESVNLNRDFCSDPDGLGVHFTEAGCEKWVEYLCTHVPA